MAKRQQRQTQAGTGTIVPPVMVSNKCIYALRAVFELSLRNVAEPVRTQDIAAAQGIPQRFLEIILAELKHSGLVRSKRGNDGGYALARLAAQITVGQVIDCVQGRQGKLSLANTAPGPAGGYAFSEMWRKVSGAISGVYDSTTFGDLVEREMARRSSYVPNYAI